jgi:hypothetical protein
MPEQLRNQFDQLLADPSLTWSLALGVVVFAVVFVALLLVSASSNKKRQWRRPVLRPYDQLKMGLPGRDTQ